MDYVYTGAMPSVVKIHHNQMTGECQYRFSVVVNVLQSVWFKAILLASSNSYDFTNMAKYHGYTNFI